MNVLLVIAFAVMVIVAIGFLAVMVAGGLDIRMVVFTRSGDSSLGRTSVIWLAVIDLIAALWLVWIA